MPRFFINRENFYPDGIMLDGEDAVHISRSLRMKVGEKIVVCDYCNYEYLCTIQKINEQQVFLSIDEKRASQNELSVDTKLFCAVLKGDKNDLVVQKAVELGASEIIFFKSENCVSKPDEKSSENKIRRWNKISAEAAKQCGRAKIPCVKGIINFSQINEYMPPDYLKLFCYEKETDKSFKSLLEEQGSNGICCLTGPEGGFSKAEADYAKKTGMISVSLGNRILRAETAPLFVMSCVSMLFD